MIVTLAVLLLLLSFFLLLWWGQERVLFQPPRLNGLPLEPGQVDYETSDGQRLIGYIVGDPDAARGVLLCFHGNADLAVWQMEWAHGVANRTGYSVFLAEYRGYMSLSGTPSYASTKLDAIAAYDHISSGLNSSAERIAYFGHSLGSAIATELAETHPPCALLLQSPFTSARAMATRIVPAPVTLAWKAISRIHFDTEQAVKRLDVPVWVAHGKHDRIVPFGMGVRVYEAAKIKGEFLAVETAGHNDVEAAGGEEYWNWITRSLDTAG